ncbi:acyl carrier protein [bacterium]|nr:acyl carrier protein [bacterium]
MENKIIDIISSVSKLTNQELIEKKEVEKLWESITHVEIVVALEEEFDIMFEQDEIASMTTVSKIIEIVRSKA